jgi:hypothetical protein
MGFGDDETRISLTGFVTYVLRVQFVGALLKHKRMLHIQAVRLNTWQSLRQLMKFALFITR